MAAEENNFDCGDYKTGELRLSYLDSGGNKPSLHFSHANGFPVSVYLPLMHRLSDQFRVIGLSLRGQDGLSDGITDWHSLASDLIDFLDSLALKPIIGVGHSIGAVTTLFSAARRPDLFSHVILLDPPLLSFGPSHLLRLLKRLGKNRHFPPAARARRRRNGWAGRQEALDHFRGKALFAGWEEAFLKAYVTYGLRPAADGGVSLICPPEAEARAFENYPLDIWASVKMLQSKVLLVRGGDSEVLTQKAYKRFLRLCSQAQGSIMAGAGHLLPMQKSEETVQMISSYVNSAD